MKKLLIAAAMVATAALAAAPMTPAFAAGWTVEQLKPKARVWFDWVEPTEVNETYMTELATLVGQVRTRNQNLVLPVSTRLYTARPNSPASGLFDQVWLWDGARYNRVK